MPKSCVPSPVAQSDKPPWLCHDRYSFFDWYSSLYSTQISKFFPNWISQKYVLFGPNRKSCARGLPIRASRMWKGLSREKKEFFCNVDLRGSNNVAFGLKGRRKTKLWHTHSCKKTWKSDDERLEWQWASVTYTHAQRTGKMLFSANYMISFFMLLNQCAFCSCMGNVANSDRRVDSVFQTYQKILNGSAVWIYSVTYWTKHKVCVSE